MTSPIAAAFAALLRAEPSALVAWTPSAPRTREDLDRASDAVAARLTATPRGRRLAVSVRDGFQLLATVLTLWRRGDCVLLLDASEPRAPRHDLARQFGAAAIVVDEPELTCVPLGDGQPAGEFAAIKLTSGSTAMPRAVGVTAANLIADADALECTMGIGASDRVFGAVPMSFSYGVGNLLVPALWSGRALVLPELRHPAGLLQALRNGEPTVLPAVPTLVRALLQGGFVAPPSLRLVLSAGGVLTPAVAAAFRRQCGLPVHSFYGATEAGGICYDREGGAAERGSVGTPVDGVAVTVDAEGRVVVESAAVGSALGDDDNPRAPMFVSPDLGVFRASELVLLGRAGESFDVGGHKVHPQEVERVIADLGGVADVVVVPFQDEHGRSACAAIVAASGLNVALVRRHCAERLPAAKVPRRIVVVAALPRSCRGKLLREDVERLLLTAQNQGGS